jgi:hypothetical protein
MKSRLLTHFFEVKRDRGDQFIFIIGFNIITRVFTLDEGDGCEKQLAIQEVLF